MDLTKLKELYEKYGLQKSDVFQHKHYMIITRSGVDKIQAVANIKIEYTLEYHTPDTFTAIVKAKGSVDDKYIETYGEVNPKNNSNGYPIAMAEKRAMSRIVLKLTGFYELGAFGEEEAEDFKEAVAKSKKAQSATNSVLDSVKKKS
jgi:hypothetical protein